MAGSANALYVPALRMKAGELQGIRDLAPDVADFILPRMIVPPPAERDDGFQRTLFASAEFPDIGTGLSAHWPFRDVLVEATHLVDDFGRDRMHAWLPKMFERARASRVNAIPFALVRDLLRDSPEAYRSSLDRTAKLQFGLALSSGDLGDRELLHRTMDALDRLGLAPEQCAIVADFHDADISAPDVVAAIIGAALEDLQSAAPWGKVIFQGTNFPETNPAEPGGYHIVARNEWIAWQKAVAFDPNTAEHLLFGDYAADCAKIAFGGSGGAAIRHYRYTTPDAWLVQRGPKGGKDEQIMRDVCEQIVASGYFAGRDFSSADDYIFRTAHGRAGPGNSKDWRAINTTHHLTRVVVDMGAVRGRSFIRKSHEPVFAQQSFLMDDR